MYTCILLCEKKTQILQHEHKIDCDGNNTVLAALLTPSRCMFGAITILVMTKLYIHEAHTKRIL